MTKIKTTLGTLKDDIKKFSDYNVWRFVTINGLDLGEKLEIQWVFARYDMDRILMLYTEIEYETPIPSVKDIIPSSWIAEAEMKDLLGANFEFAKKGAFLEPDAKENPLRKAK